MNKLETVQLGTMETLINGKMREVRLWLEVYPDDIDPADISDPEVFESEDAYKDYLADFDAGNRGLYVVVVKAAFAGITGTDSLGGIEHYYKQRWESIRDGAVRDHDMTAMAVKDLVDQCETLVKTLA